jgi:hypothetical protein
MRKTLSMKLLLSMLAACMLFPPIAFSGMYKELPEADGKDLIRYITEQKPYEHWSLWPGTSRLYKGTSPHGAFLTTYVNAPVLNGLDKDQVPLPDGSIVVKENYDKQKKLAAVTVMYKKKGYDPNHGDWFYLKYAPGGKIQAEGRVESCMKCHARASDADWLFNYQE